MTSYAIQPLVDVLSSGLYRFRCFLWRAQRFFIYKRQGLPNLKIWMRCYDKMVLESLSFQLHIHFIYYTEASWQDILVTGSFKKPTDSWTHIQLLFTYIPTYIYFTLIVQINCSAETCRIKIKIAFNSSLTTYTKATGRCRPVSPYF